MVPDLVYQLRMKEGKTHGQSLPWVGDTAQHCSQGSEENSLAPKGLPPT